MKIESSQEKKISTSNEENQSDNNNKMCKAATAPPLKPATMSEKQLPSVARFWFNLYQSAPKVYVGGGDRHRSSADGSSRRFDVGFMLMSVVFFLIVKTIIHYVILERFLGWPADGTIPDKPTVTWDAAACFTGCVHSINLVFAIGTLFWCSDCFHRPSCAIRDHPQWWQDMNAAVMQFCTGYMVYDTLCNVLAVRWQGGLDFAFTADDYMFFGHHLATIFYMTGTRVLHAGHMSALVLMFAGELTNPFLNTYLVSGYVKDLECCAFRDSTVAAIEIPLAVLFLSLRVFIGPFLCLYISYDLLFTKQGLSLIPLTHSIPWNLMMWGVVFGAVPWIFHLWEVLQKYLPNNDGEMAVVPEL